MKIRNKLILISLLVVIAAIGYSNWPEERLPKDFIAERIIVYKEQGTLELWANSKIAKSYQISLGQNPVGHKQHEGDSKTPEGLYIINDKNPNSSFHLNLGISYPNEQDKINSPNPGSAIKIHGIRNGLGFIGKFQRYFNWTDGCIAVTNKEIEELYRAVPIGTPIYINP